MRKNLLIGSLLAVTLILLLPTVSAVEFSAAYQPSYGLSSKEATLQTLIKKQTDNPEPNCIILLTIAILFLKLLKWGLGHFRIADILFGVILLVILTMLGG
jgi:hypothetical protein